MLLLGPCPYTPILALPIIAPDPAQQHFTMEGVNNQHRQQRIVLARQILAQLIGLMVPGYFRSLTDRTRGKNQQESVTGNDKNNEVGVWKPLDIRTKARITFSRDSAQLSKQREFDQNTTGHPNRLGRCRVERPRCGT